MRRVLRPRGADDDLLDLASNDYLGLARDPRVAGAAAAAAAAWGAGSTGSRLVTGSTDLHAELEAALAAFVGAPAGAGVLLRLPREPRRGHRPGRCRHPRRLRRAEPRLPRGRLPARGRAGSWSRRTATSTPSRQRCSASAPRSGRSSSPTPCSRSTATSRRSPSCTPSPGATAHCSSSTRRTASASSAPDGRGACRAAGLAGEPDVVLTVTLSKSLGSQGGAVLGDAVVVEHLVNTARAFIFDTGLAPAAAGGALAALGVLRDEPGLATAVRQRAVELAAALATTGLPVTTPQGAVVSVLVGDPGAGVRRPPRLLRDAGLRVGCFRPPSVPDGVSRLRLHRPRRPHRRRRRPRRRRDPHGPRPLGATAPA